MSDGDLTIPRTANDLSDQSMTGIPLNSRLKDSERDSGYVSAPRPPTLTVSCDLAIQEDVEFGTAGHLKDAKHQNADEVEPIESDNDDIGSQNSDTTTNEEKVGKLLPSTSLVEELQFKGLCEKALDRMDRRQFVDSLGRLLKLLHKSLLREAESEPEKAVARLLRSRRRRTWISHQIALHVQQEREEAGSDRNYSQIVPEQRLDVERWLSHTLERPVDHEEKTLEPEFQFQGVDSESSTSGSDDGSDDPYPHTSKLEKFLRETKSYQILLNHFRLMFLPTELRNVFLSIRKEYITVSQEQNHSLANRAKAWVEDNTQVPWNWWPLERRKRMLHEGEA